MIRPSPNEFERLKSEEFNKRRILRLKEVREHSKNNASKLRCLYKEQKSKVLNKLAENIQMQINSEDEKKLDDLKCKYEKQYHALGGAHSNAVDWIDPIILMKAQAENCAYVAQERHLLALDQMKVDKEDRDIIRNNRLKALNLAMLIEKERAAAIASLPPPIADFNVQDYLKDIDDMTPRVRVCDRNKFSVIESYEVGSYNVERSTDESQRFQYKVNNAMDAGEIRQQQLLKMNSDVQMESEEKSIIAQLRGHQAIKKQIVKKDYGELLTNLEQISKGEMAKRQREYHKNEFVGPDSPGYLRMGQIAAMQGYKERCRERAVESAVMESLKDITNNSSLQQSNVIVESIEEETKLSKLYNIIKKQKENVIFESADPNENINISSMDINQERSALTPQVNDESMYVECSRDIDFTKTTVKEAMEATVKSSIVLDKSTKEKEIFNIEKKIEDLDKRLDQIKERNEGSVSLLSQISPTLRPYGKGYFDDQSQERSEIPSSESICSDSLNIIRQFQRNALLKLSGHPGVKQFTGEVFTSNRDLLQSSLDSTCVSERSVSTFTQVKDVQHIDDLSSSAECESSVSEWVRSQLIQTIDKLPDWVTRSDVQNFLPDLNMSFMSSILNIRSESDSLKDDTHSSCSTLLTRSSIVRRTGHSSITEISKIGSDARCTSSLNYQSETSIDNSSVRVTEPFVLKDNGKVGVDIIKEKSNVEGDLHIQNQLKTDSYHSEDLINFESTEDFAEIKNTGTEDDISYLTALRELISIADKSSYSQIEGSDGLVNHHVSISDDEEESTLITILSDNVSKTSASGMAYLDSARNADWDIQSNEDLRCNKDEDAGGYKSSLTVRDSKDLTASEYLSSHSNVQPAHLDKPLYSLDNHNADLLLNNDDHSLIYDYERFLSGLVNRPLLSPGPSVKKDNDSNDVQGYDATISIRKDIINLEGGHEQDSLESKEIVNQEGFSSEGKDICSAANDAKEVSYLTSTTKEGHTNLITLSVSSIQSSNLLLKSAQHQSELSFNNFGMQDNEISSEDFLEPLSPYISDTSESISNNKDKKFSTSSEVDENAPVNQDIELWNKNRVKNLLSSTMKPNRQNVRMLSPDISSISNISVETCNRLKEKIMQEYFEKNRSTILASLCKTESSGLSMKPLESYEDNSPRHLDSGKPSSRLTMDLSELNTGRLTSEDIFMTPRNDTTWTDYTPRDEWSTSHTNFQALSDYISTVNDDNINQEEHDLYRSMEKVDLDETLKNADDESPNFENRESINLINFGSNDELNEDQGIRSNASCLGPCFSEESDVYSYDFTVKEDSIPSKESSDHTDSSFKVLASYHSLSSEVPSCHLNTKEIQEFETQNDTSLDSKSEADVSSVSLASFLRNESLCQQTDAPLESTPKRKVISKIVIDNNEEMKTNLALWKKERLTRLNKVIPDLERDRATLPLKTSSNRKQDEVLNKSRTLRLYNNLEEVQKMNQKKEAEQMKIYNQLKKKEYAERLRKMKKEKLHGKG